MQPRHLSSQARCTTNTQKHSKSAYESDFAAFSGFPVFYLFNFRSEHCRAARDLICTSCAEVLVLNETGTSKPSEWVWDTVVHILNTRYNTRKVKILTTNYPNLPPASSRYAESATGQARSAMREESLGDRLRSRLQEMYLPIEMLGQDFRQNIKRASLVSVTWVKPGDGD